MKDRARPFLWYRTASKLSCCDVGLGHALSHLILKIAPWNRYYDPQWAEEITEAQGKVIRPTLYLLPDKCPHIPSCSQKWAHSLIKELTLTDYWSLGRAGHLG